jgi:hypothetical protein
MPRSFLRLGGPKRDSKAISTADSFSVTRRGFIAGAASTAAVVSAGYADTNVVQFSIQENESDITIDFRNARCLAPVTFKIAKDYWSTCASASDLAIAAPAKCKPPKFTITDVAGKPMPDGSIRRTVTVDIQNANFAGQKTTFSAKFVFQLVDQDCQLILTTVGWPRSGKTQFAPVDFVEFMSTGRLRVALSAGETSNLVRALFGSSVTSAKGSSNLAVGNDLSWTLSGPFSMPAGLDPSSASRFKFDCLRFAPTSRNTPTSRNPTPFSKEVLGAAFPKLFGKPDAAFSPPPGIAGYSDGALAGATAVELGKYGKIRVTATSISPVTAAFLQFGKSVETVSGVTGDFQVVVKQEKPEGSFLTEGATIVRYGTGGASGFARLPIASKAFEVTTAYGRFCIEAADPTLPQPGAEQIKPGIVLSTDNGNLTSFEVAALIRQAFIPFPADADGSKRNFFSRLDFSGADCKFVLDPLAELTPLYSSGSFIRLCVPSDAPPGTYPVRLGLDQAVLQAVRPDDLLSLKFRFSGLVLTSGGKPDKNAVSQEPVTKIVPLRGGACGVHLAQQVNQAHRTGAPLQARFLPGAAVDDRPIMVVEFPPQHVAERAYFRQIDDGADPPDAALSDDATEALYHWLGVLDRYRKGGKVDLDQRIAARREVQFAKCLAEKAAAGASAPTGGAGAPAPGDAAKANSTSGVPTSTVTFHQFCGSFEREAELQPLSRCWPDDQKIYIGSEWLDPDVRRFARQLAAKMARDAADQSSNSFRTSNTKSGAQPPPSIDEAVREKLPAVDLKDPDFQNWVAAYDRWGERLFGGLPRYCGPDSVQALVDTGQINNATLAMLVAKIEADVGGPEDFSDTQPTEARLCGPTRLAFRINCNDFEPGGGSFPFTLADLTNWSRFDLSVVRRAEKLLDFDSSGKLPPHWARKEILDPASLLIHQGIHPARSWIPGVNSQRVSVAQRMAEVYASANTRPQPLETAIELPFRLTLSPAQDARWRTPALSPRNGFPIPVWQASLDEDVSRSSLRAIWSEDFQPDVLRDGTPAPPHGVWAPWDPPVPQDDGSPPHANTRFRAVMDGGDRHELVTLSSVYGLPVNGRRDSSQHLLSDGDQIEPPPGYRLLGLPDDTDAIYSPRALNVTELALSALGGSVSLDTHFQPPAGVKPAGKSDPLFVLDVERWRHTAVLGRDISVEVVYKGFLFPLGNRVSFVKLTERRIMRHPAGGPTAYLIQRMFLRVGNPKKTFPALGQANLGRCFPPQTINILTRRTPDIVDPTDHPSIGWTGSFREYANGAVSFKSNTGDTPLAGLVFWPRVSSSESGNVRFEVQIDDTGGSVSMPMLFVDNVAAHTPETVEALTGYYNQSTMESKRTVLHGGTPRRYAIETKQGDSTFETLSWILKAEGGGDTSQYSGPQYNKNFALSSPLEGADQPPFYPYLHSCVIRLNQVGKFTGGQAPLATARYYPPYLEAGFSGDKNSSETFFQTVPTGPVPKATSPAASPAPVPGLPPMAFGSSGDRAAGVGRPENQIVALSRKNGPIGGSKPLTPPLQAPAPSTSQTAQSKAAQTSSSTTTTPDTGDYATPAEFDPSKFNPTSFFGSFGKLLGIIDLGDVIEAAADLTGMPQLSETIDYASTQGWDIVRQTILQPLSDILDTLDKTWASMNVGLTGTAADQIKNVFPDVAAAEDALRAAVKSALGVAAPSLDQQAQLIGTVYEKARAFIQALQRLAADPLGPISIALQKQVNGLGQFLNKIAADQLHTISAAIDDFLNETLDNISGALSKAATIDLLCAIGSLLDGRIDGATQTEILKAFASDVQERLKKNDSVRLDVIFQAAFQDAFNKEPPPVQDALKDIAQAAPYIWQGDYYAFLAPKLFALQGQANALVAASKDAAEKASADAIAKLVDAAIGVLTNILVFLNLRPPGADACSKTIVAVSGFLTATRGDQADTWITGLRSCIDQPNSCAAGPLHRLAELLSPPFSPDLSLAQLLVQALQQLSAVPSAAPSQLKTWASDLLTKLKTPIHAIADELQALQDEPPASTQEDAAAACKDIKLDKLKEIATSQMRQLGTRKKLIEAIGDVDKIVIEALKNFPDNIIASIGKQVILAAVSLERILIAGFVDQAVKSLNDTLSALVNLDPSQPASGVGQVSTLVAPFDEAIQVIIELDDDAQIEKAVREKLITAAANAISQNFADATQTVVAQASGVLLEMLQIADGLIADLLPIIPEILAPLKAINGWLEKESKAAKGGLDEITSNQQAALALQPLIQQISPPLSDLVASTADAEKKLDDPDLNLPKIDRLDSVTTATLAAKNAVSSVVDAMGKTVKAVTNVSQALFKGQIAKLIDVNAPRREIESLIRDLAPHKATMAYSLDTQLSPFADVFIPDLDRGSGRLTINTTAVVDLLSPVQTPQTTVKGVLDPFNIHLFGDLFDVVTLKFKQAQFGSSPGSNFKFTIDLEDVVLGEMVAFLQALQSYLTPSDGNGFYLRPASGSPGIEVGYGLNLGTISLGPVSFINVSLNAGCRLPFDKSNALFTISLSRPDSPFLISVGIYGGGGYLGLIADGKSIVGFEASFEFGGVSAFSFGPLNGIGMLTTGIFLRKLYDKTTIEGFFFCGGSARIACFGISASLMVSISMEPGGGMVGQAVFSFSFSIGPVHFDFHVTVFKTQAKLGGSASAEPIGPPRTQFAELTSDLPPALLASYASSDTSGGPRLYATTMSPNRNWRQYRRYFATDIKPVITL